MVHKAVLFVDDDEFVLHSLRRALVQEPYPKLYAKSAFEAYELLKANEVCIVVTDMKMPVTDGLTFLTDLKNRYPDIVRMVLSGYAQVSQIIQSINRGEIFRYIAKPWDEAEELQNILKEGLEFYRKRMERKNIAEERDALKGQLVQIQQQSAKLTGTLPLCRLCNKVHLDEQDEWETLARFITHGTDLHFSETICPACAPRINRGT